MTAPLVLVADNDPLVSSLLVEVLKMKACEVQAALDGAQAREMLSETPFDVLVCDLDMPKVGGLELLEGLAGAAAVPLTIVISGYLDDPIQARLRALPFVREILKKPFDMLKFADRVRELAAEEQGLAAAGHEDGVEAVVGGQKQQADGSGGSA